MKFAIIFLSVVIVLSAINAVVFIWLFVNPKANQNMTEELASQSPVPGFNEDILCVPDKVYSSMDEALKEANLVCYVLIQDDLQFSSLQPEIGALKNINNLTIKNTSLSKLPPDIGQLSQLIVLNLPNNKLNSLPPEIGQLIRLNNLDLSNNQLTTLPDTISGLTNLLLLDVSGNPLLPAERAKISQLLPQTAIRFDVGGEYVQGE